MNATSLSSITAGLLPRRHSELDYRDTKSKKIDGYCSVSHRLRRRPAIKEKITWQEMFEVEEHERPATAITRSSTVDARSDSLVRPRLKFSARLMGKKAATSRQSALPPDAQTYNNQRFQKSAQSSSSSSKVDDTLDAEMNERLRRIERDFDHFKQEMQCLLASKDREVETAHYELSMAWQEVGRLFQKDINLRAALHQVETELTVVKATLKESLKLSDSRAKSLQMLQDDQKLLQMHNYALRGKLTRVPEECGEESELMRHETQKVHRVDESGVQVQPWSNSVWEKVEASEKDIVT